MTNMTKVANVAAPGANYPTQPITAGRDHNSHNSHNSGGQSQQQAVDSDWSSNAM